MTTFAAALHDPAEQPDLANLVKLVANDKLPWSTRTAPNRPTTSWHSACPEWSSEAAS
eukprot:CAMPEP_0203913694 /NCGR_PEP_ID=MMETSP0359-20131031/54660_1 /ASSEMBLY_ACC=CAM_ASM_000338 /TAXON_ID=268821 /ORGANISM="Scrippsiella Hangoei, Strain SHTV-5" /LENGTH=57 /DNA_ID=CAMNT_0050839877 /DNA_START=90 /DNA_END=263 /DNA_ORIENTATION=+